MPSSRIAILEGYSGTPRGYGRGESMPESIPRWRPSMARRPYRAPSMTTAAPAPHRSYLTTEVPFAVPSLPPRRRTYRPEIRSLYPSSYAVPRPALPAWARTKRRKTRKSQTKRSGSQKKMAVCARKCGGKKMKPYQSCLRKCRGVKKRRR